MKHASVTVPEADPTDAPATPAAYDPAAERAAARRLKGARWRRLALAASAVCLAAAAAGAFTLANHDAIRSQFRADPPDEIEARPAAAQDAPSLASGSSRPVQLPGQEAASDKVQARIVVPADPEPQPVRPATADTAPAGTTSADAAPVQMQDGSRSGPRTIPLAPGPSAVASAEADAEAPPAAALGFAPLPAPRPQRAP